MVSFTEADQAIDISKEIWLCLKDEYGQVSTDTQERLAPVVAEAVEFGWDPNLEELEMLATGTGPGQVLAMRSVPAGIGERICTIIDESIFT